VIDGSRRARGISTAFALSWLKWLESGHSGSHDLQYPALSHGRGRWPQQAIWKRL